MNFQDEMRAIGVRILRDDYREWRGCQRKVPHSTKDGALHAMRSFADPEQMNVYFCKHCFSWHVGHRSVR